MTFQKSKRQKWCYFFVRNRYFLAFIGNDPTGTVTKSGQVTALSTKTVSLVVLTLNCLFPLSSTSSFPTKGLSSFPEWISRTSPMAIVKICAIDRSEILPQIGQIRSLGMINSACSSGQRNRSLVYMISKANRSCCHMICLIWLI